MIKVIRTFLLLKVLFFHLKFFFIVRYYLRNIASRGKSINQIDSVFYLSAAAQSKIYTHDLGLFLSNAENIQNIWFYDPFLHNLRTLFYNFIFSDIKRS